MTGHTLVVGAGISGLSVALALLHRGHGASVLERGAVGGESSWAGGGILSPLLPWNYAEPVSALALRSMAAYADWVANIEAISGRDAEFWRCGMLALDVTAPEQALAWCATHGMAAQRGYPDALHRLPDTLKVALKRSPFVIAGEMKQSGMLAESAPDGLPRLFEPRDDGINQRILNKDGHIWLPDVAQVRNPRLVAALRAAVLRLGGKIREECPITGVLTQGGRVTAVRTKTDTFPADSVVLATGAWSGLGLAGLAAMPQIRPIRGQMLLFKLEPGVLDTILYRNGLYLIPRRDGHVLVGSTLEDAGFDKTTDAATHQRLHAEAAELLPILADARPVRHWAGLRPGSPGNIPVIDRHPDFDNVFVNAGHYRYGVTMAPASAELLLDLMEGRTPALDPAPYRWQAALERAWSACF
ncbi:FAD-dependent oxidoreductase [Thiobacillus sp. 65-1402]|uniref:NAD(P)/FAD-dependent oxidoreductase n=1 Tax=Thiobacillus sp. 65-1402 TaxID=1895861 RepID=UPI0025D02A46|nr:FAD-dependent oxidoreductase [Thiobacillus sp. 65-1402]